MLEGAEERKGRWRANRDGDGEDEGHFTVLQVMGFIGDYISKCSASKGNVMQCGEQPNTIKEC